MFNPFKKIVSDIKASLRQRYFEDLLRVPEIGGIGEGTYVRENLKCRGNENIHFGKRNALNTDNVIYAENAEVTLGDYVMTSCGNYFFTRDPWPQEGKPDNSEPVIIEDDVWIGSKCIFMKGVRVGRGSVIKAGSLVTEDVLPYTVYMSKNLQYSKFTARQIEEHEEKIKDKYGKTYPAYTPPDVLIRDH